MKKLLAILLSAALLLCGCVAPASQPAEAPTSSAPEPTSISLSEAEEYIDFLFNLRLSEWKTPEDIPASSYVMWYGYCLQAAGTLNNYWVDGKSSIAFPAEELEAEVTRYFDVPLEHLRSACNSKDQLYEIPTALMPTTSTTAEITEITSNGSLTTICFTLCYNEVQRVEEQALTLKTENDGFHYLSYLNLNTTSPEASDNAPTSAVDSSDYIQYDFDTFSLMLPKEYTVQNNTIYADSNFPPPRIVAEVTAIDPITDTTAPFAPYNELYSDSKAIFINNEAITVFDFNFNGYPAKRYWIQTEILDDPVGGFFNQIIYCIQGPESMVTITFYPAQGLGGIQLQREEFEISLQSITF